MGGSVFIGIRRRNGEIYMGQRWTNPTSWWFNHPEMYDADEKRLLEYINLQEEPTPRTEIEPSEYGVILYDALKGRLLSRQCYTGLGKYLIASSCNAEDLEVVRLLRDRKLVQEIQVWPHQPACSWGIKKGKPAQVVMDPEQMPRFWALLFSGQEYPLRRLNGADAGMFDLHWKIEGLEVDHKGGTHGYHYWPEVMAWVEECGWNVPIWSKERVIKDRAFGEENAFDTGEDDAPDDAVE